MGRIYNNRHVFRSDFCQCVRDMRLLKWMGRPQVHTAGLLVSLLAVLAVVVFMIATLEYTKTRGRLLLTAFLVGGYFLTALAATGMPRSRTGRRLRAGAQALATAALFLLLLGLWGTPDSDGYWKATAVVTILSLGSAVAGILLVRAMSGRAVRFLSLASATLLILLTVLAASGIVAEIRAPLYWWVFVLLALSWLAMSAAVVAAPVWNRRGRA